MGHYDSCYEGHYEYERKQNVKRCLSEIEKYIEDNKDNLCALEYLSKMIKSEKKVRRLFESIQFANKFDI